jgi:hypothetical protein
LTVAEPLRPYTAIQWTYVEAYARTARKGWASYRADASQQTDRRAAQDAARALRNEGNAILAYGVGACEGCKPRPLCRDCADNDGTCPDDGLPCDPKARHTCDKHASSGRPLTDEEMADCGLLSELDEGTPGVLGIDRSKA